MKHARLDQRRVPFVSHSVIAKQGSGSKAVERAIEMSDEDMARYATYGGFLVMLLLIIYHYEITPSKAE